MSLSRDSRIFLAGHRGLIGSAMARLLKKRGHSHVIVRTRDQLNLCDQAAVHAFIKEERPEYIVLAAGRVGGILQNRRHPASLMSENLSIQSNIIHAAHQCGVKRLILFGSSCMYPRETTQPMHEGMLLSGRPEPTSLPYAVSKLAGVELCLAYNAEFADKYGATRFVPVIPNNAYGPNDDFNPETGHVLSALIARFQDAKVKKAPEVTLWGTGKPRREFVHSDDIANAVYFLLQHDLAGVELPINIGVGQDYSIKEVAEIIAKEVGYQGQIKFDSKMPDGAPQKLLCNKRMTQLGWVPQVSMQQGLRDTISWYLSGAKNEESFSDTMRENASEAISLRQ